MARMFALSESCALPGRVLHARGGAATAHAHAQGTRAHLQALGDQAQQRICERGPVRALVVLPPELQVCSQTRHSYTVIPIGKELKL